MRNPLEVRRRIADRARWELLAQLSHALSGPMTLLAFVWLGLMVAEFTTGLSAPWERVGIGLWALFVAHFLLEIAIAPRKLNYLRRHWLTALSLVVPAVRVLRAVRALRALRALRGVRLIRVVGSLNRGLRAVGRLMGRRGAGYVATITLLVVTGGAAGMYAFESAAAGSTLDSYGSALWWTAMVITTMGTDFFPRSAEGRLLCLLLATYGFAVWGYITANIASVFVVRESAAERAVDASAAELTALRREIAALRATLTEDGRGGGGPRAL